MAFPALLPHGKKDRRIDASCSQRLEACWTGAGWGLSRSVAHGSILEECARDPTHRGFRGTPCAGPRPQGVGSPKMKAMKRKRIHTYRVSCSWTDELGAGTRDYDSYSRNHVIAVDGKPSIDASADGAFRGDPDRLNPEELFVASLASCHMLRFLHLCGDSGLMLRSYRDVATATMTENASVGEFSEVILKPACRFDGNVDPDLVEDLHRRAHASCFIARSVRCPVRIEVISEDAEGSRHVRSVGPPPNPEDL